MFSKLKCKFDSTTPQVGGGISANSRSKAAIRDVEKSLFLRKICLLVVVLRLPVPPFRLRPPLSLKRAGTTLAAESLASNVITHDATTMKPSKRNLRLRDGQ